MTIRLAQMSDADAIAGIHASCFDPPWSSESFLRLLEHPGAVAFIAADAPETDLQAFILIRLAADEAEIISLGTLSSARRVGFARALLARAMEEAAQRGATAMFLEVAADNEAALALYESCGFALLGRRKAYYERPGASADALVLWRSLP